MHIVVNHNISNTADFWASAQKNLPSLPEGGVKRIVSVFPNHTMDKCTCIWEAEFIDNLDNYLRDKVKDWSKDSYYELNGGCSNGLSTLKDDHRLFIVINMNNRTGNTKGFLYYFRR